MHKKRAVWEKHLANSQGSPTPQGVTPPQPVVPTPQIITPPVITPPPQVVTPRVVTPPMITPPSTVYTAISTSTGLQTVSTPVTAIRVSVIQPPRSTGQSPPTPPPTPPSPPTMMNTATPPLKRPVALTGTEGEPPSKKAKVLPSVFTVTGVVASNLGAGEGTSGTASSSAGASSSGSSASASASTSSHPGPATGPLGGDVVHTTASPHSIFTFLLYLGDCFKNYQQVSLVPYPFLTSEKVKCNIEKFNSYTLNSKNTAKGYRAHRALTVSKILSVICNIIKCKYPKLFPHREILRHMVSSTLPFYTFWISESFLLNPNTRGVFSIVLDAEEYIVCRKNEWERLWTRLNGFNTNDADGAAGRMFLMKGSRHFRKDYTNNVDTLKQYKKDIIGCYRSSLDSLGINHSDIN